jgi:hypothetical protein
MSTNTKAEKSGAAAVEFVPLLCPQCLGLVGEVDYGHVRLLCLKCQLRTIFLRPKLSKIPRGMVYVVILSSESYTPGVV